MTTTTTTSSQEELLYPTLIFPSIRSLREQFDSTLALINQNTVHMHITSQYLKLQLSDCFQESTFQRIFNAGIDYQVKIVKKTNNNEKNEKNDNNNNNNNKFPEQNAAEYDMTAICNALSSTIDEDNDDDNDNKEGKKKKNEFKENQCMWMILPMQQIRIGITYKPASSSSTTLKKNPTWKTIGPNNHKNNNNICWYPRVTTGPTVVARVSIKPDNTNLPILINLTDIAVLDIPNNQIRLQISPTRFSLIGTSNNHVAIYNYETTSNENNKNLNIYTSSSSSQSTNTIVYDVQFSLRPYRALQKLLSTISRIEFVLIKKKTRIKLITYLYHSNNERHIGTIVHH